MPSHEVFRCGRDGPDFGDCTFKAQPPGRLWMPDIGHVPATSGFPDLAVVVEVLSRRVVGSSMQNHLRAGSSVDARDGIVG